MTSDHQLRIDAVFRWALHAYEGRVDDHDAIVAIVALLSNPPETKGDTIPAAKQPEHRDPR